MMNTLIELFETSVAKYPENILLYEKHDGEYKGFSYRDIFEQVQKVAAGFVSFGIKKGDRIGLLSEGRVDWLVAELAMFYAGAINVPLSIKLESSEVAFRLKHSGARMVLASWTQIEKCEAVFNSLSALEQIVYFDELDAPQKHQLPFQKIKSEGEKFLKEAENVETMDALKASITPNDVANISYTSGTTADPKGIMLTQQNYAVNVVQANSLMTITENHKTLTILPWDHSFAHTACLYCFMYNGASIGCQEIGKTPLETLKNIPKNINEIKPHIMMSVPAFSKAFRKNIESGIKAKGKTTANLFDFAMKVAYAYNGIGYDKGKGSKALLKPLNSIFDKILFSKIRENFGGNMEFFIGGGALLDIELQRFFAAIGMPVMQGYGLSEASPVISSNALHAVKFGSSGKLVKYMDVKICDDDGVELPLGHKGEIVIKGGNVMLGYWNNPESTKDTVKDGWLYTGDMGYIDQDGFLFVLGRFKSLLIGNDGEKFSPEGIEEAIVDQSKYIDQCMLYNNQNPYTTGFIVPNFKALKDEVKVQGLDIATEDGQKAAIKIIEEEINAYKTGGKFEEEFPDRWLPAAFLVLPEAFTEENKLINSTMKMVRGKIVEYFADELEYVYTPEAKNSFNAYNLKSITAWNK